MTIFLVNSSDFPADVPDFDRATADVTLRRPQQFRPEPGTKIDWVFTRDSDGVVFEEGSLIVPADGLVTVEGLTIFKSRGRLEVFQKGEGSLSEREDEDDLLTDILVLEEDDDPDCCGC